VEVVMEHIRENLEDVKSNINSVCSKIGKNADDVLLVAVSKTIDEEIVNKSIEYGVTDIGENKVQEITRKFENIKAGVKWHLIGHLQRNKVKYIIDKVCMIHSVDSFRLAEEIDKKAKDHDLVMDILIQVNVAMEESKFGIGLGDLDGLLEEISTLKNVRVMGLMTIAPFELNPEDVRKYFKKLKNKFDSLSTMEYDNIRMKYLSMGMTNDYMVAIEEGANIVRVGTGIYGARNYNK
jgi:pyridoxal phosphate enzyme (YggS family)